MLDAHPLLAIPPETHFIPRVIAACRAADDPGAAFVQTLNSLARWDDFQIDAEAVGCAVAALPEFTVSDALRAFYRLYAARFGKPRWGDKTPPYLLRMRRIQRFLPEARFIHLIRDGRDVALSLQGVWFGPTSVREAGELWVSQVLAGQSEGHRLGSSYLEVRYEDLVLQSEATLRRICSHLDLAWDPAMLGYFEQASERLSEHRRDYTLGNGQVVRADDRLRIHALTSHPPDAERIGRWRRDMSAVDRRWFEQRAGGLLRELGYDAE